MPAKVDKIYIKNEKLDKRVKLLAHQKLEIFNNKEGLSQRKLAKLYGVSRRTIQFILDPEKLKRNKEARELLGGSKAYYDKEKHTKAMKVHRDYKRELLDKNLIGKNVK